MKSGKSSAAIQYAIKYSTFVPVLVVNSAKDSRSDSDVISTHSGSELKCVKVNKLSELVGIAEFVKARVVVIDEAQFFDDLYEHVCDYHHYKTYIVASLNGDYKQELFGQAYKLLPLANEVEMMQGLCDVCKDNPSFFTIAGEGKKTKDQVDVAGFGSNKFRSVCKKHLE